MTVTVDRHSVRTLLVISAAVALGLAGGGCGGSAPPSGSDAERVARAESTASERRAPRRERIASFQAEGTIDPGWVLPPGAVPPPPEGLEFRARCVYPDAEGLLDLSIFVTAVGAPTMLPLPPDDSIAVVSHLRARVDRAWVSRAPEPNLLITGAVLSTPKPSPFGPQIGRLVAVTSAFDGKGPEVTFSQLAFTVSGSHATTLPVASGAVGTTPQD